MLFLAPMESLGDWCLRRALALGPGGMDEACTEFIRCPNNVSSRDVASVARGLAKRYVPSELADGCGSWTPLGAQVMGGSPEMLEATCRALVRRGAPRVDLNCGCPSNTVTGKGAGSSLLRDPERVKECVAALLKGSDGVVPVTGAPRSLLPSLL